MVFKKLAKKLSDDRKSFVIKGGSYNPLTFGQSESEKKFRNHLSESALKLYERENDIKKFTDMALSSPLSKEDNIFLDMLFENGVIDTTNDKVIKETALNKKLMKDLGF